jgi:hypothetical protein
MINLFFPLLLLQWLYMPVCGSWSSLWFRISKFFRGELVRPTLNPLVPLSTPNLEDQGPYFTSPYSLMCLAWMALPGAYAPASIALHDKAVILEEVSYSLMSNIKLRVNIPVSF